MIAHKSSTDDILELRKVFHQYDVANNGTISYEEFLTAIKEKDYAEEKVKEIFNSMVRLPVSKCLCTESFFSAVLVEL